MFDKPRVLATFYEPRPSKPSARFYIIVPIDAPRTGLYVGRTANVRPGNLPAGVIWRIRLFEYAPGSFQVSSCAETR
jgi:hypothetical protein